MAPKCKIILDTDPGMSSSTQTSSKWQKLTFITGVDDVMALLLALSASPEELELAMISVTYGNVPLQS